MDWIGQWLLHRLVPKTSSRGENENGWVKYGSWSVVSYYYWTSEKYTKCLKGLDIAKYRDFSVPPTESAELIRLDARKRIWYLKKEGTTGKVGGYVKTETDDWRRIWAGFRRDGVRYQLNATRELATIRLYQSHEVPVVEPLAYGEKRVCGWPVSGFLMQKEVVGEEYHKLLPRCTPLEKKRLLRAYGRLVAKIHSAGLFFPIVRVTDLICTTPVNVPWEEIRLVVIDREKGGRPNNRTGMELCAYTLALILARYVIYVSVPKRTEVAAFLGEYVKHLDVAVKPCLRRLYKMVGEEYGKFVAEREEAAIRKVIPRSWLEGTA